MSLCKQEASADATLQYQFTAYVQTALRRQQQRSQAKLNQIRYHECESDISATELEYNMLDGTIALELMRLTQREQEILLLHVMDKLRFSDIASILGISECAAQKAYRRTIAFLREKLEDI